MADILLDPDTNSVNRQRLKNALELASRAQDNHLRAIVLALISAHYFHTAGDHALSMLQACEQLAAGLGASVKKPVDGSPANTTAVGNARLGLWVGQKYLGGSSGSGRWNALLISGCGGAPELYKRAGKEHRVQKQLVANERLEEAVKVLSARGCTGS